jgi:hypothetical protein
MGYDSHFQTRRPLVQLVLFARALVTRQRIQSHGIELFCGLFDAHLLKHGPALGAHVPAAAAPLTRKARADVQPAIAEAVLRLMRGRGTALALLLVVAELEEHSEALKRA